MRYDYLISLADDSRHTDLRVPAEMWNALVEAAAFEGVNLPEMSFNRAISARFAAVIRRTLAATPSEPSPAADHVEEAPAESARVSKLRQEIHELLSKDDSPGGFTASLKSAVAPPKPRRPRARPPVYDHRAALLGQDRLFPGVL